MSVLIIDPLYHGNGKDDISGIVKTWRMVHSIRAPSMDGADPSIHT